MEHLDRLNYHEAWIGEHHSGGFELIACPEMFIAAAAQRTRHIRLGTGVVSLPYHNPFMLADRMVQLDHMTRGRAMFGVGPGRAWCTMRLKIGIDPGDQREMMDESFDVIVRLLNGEIVNAQDRLVQPDRGAIAAAPLHAADDGTGGRRRALAVGLRASPANTASACCRSAAPARWRWSATPPIGGSTRRPRAPTATRPDRKDWRVVGMFHIAETREQARKNVQFGVQAFANYFRDVATFPIIPPEVAGPDRLAESKPAPAASARPTTRSPISSG